MYDNDSESGNCCISSIWYDCMCGNDKEDIENTLEVPDSLEFVDANGFCKSRLHTHTHTHIHAERDRERETLHYNSHTQREIA